MKPKLDNPHSLLKNREIAKLREQIRLLEHQNALPKKERDFFRRTPTLAQALKGETLIAKLTGGVLTGCKHQHDVTVPSGARIEVKYSHLNAPGTSKTRRWNWHSPLAMSNNKQYEYLVLIGKKIQDMKISIRSIWLPYASWCLGQMSTTSGRETTLP